MSAGLAALIAGLFVVPLALLWSGHRLRRRTSRYRAVFWGALLGHLVASSIALLVSIFPPTEWAATDFWRGFGGYWLPVLLPALGAIIGALRRTAAPLNS
ncbi:MAG: hypothetical protein H7Z74_05990 [Anaerolineae bacterium]|nr:hypothetical protein [Gemmatimonadaceae bacterium]